MRASVSALLVVSRLGNWRSEPRSLEPVACDRFRFALAQDVAVLAGSCGHLPAPTTSRARLPVPMSAFYTAPIVIVLGRHDPRLNRFRPNSSIIYRSSDCA